MDRASSNRPAVMFNPLSATYHVDLHKAKLITDAQLAAAQSGNRANIDAADAEALKEGIAESLSSLATFTADHPLTQKQSKAIRPGQQSSMEHEHARQRKRDTLLKSNYAKKSYRFMDSKIEDHNCLITSILQHAKNEYGTKHQALAQEYRDRLNTHLQEGLTPAQKKKFLRNDLLDRSSTDWLLKEMAKDRRLQNRDLAVEFWIADDKGEPVRLTFGEGKTTVLIFNSTDHFEAVIPPSFNATTADPALAKKKSAAGTPEKQGQNTDASFKYFYETPNPLKNMIDTA